MTCPQHEHVMNSRVERRIPTRLQTLETIRTKLVETNQHQAAANWTVRTTSTRIRRYRRSGFCLRRRSS